MRNLGLFIGFVISCCIVLTLSGCPKSSSPSPVMNPLAAAGCDVETTIMDAFGQVVVSQCAGTGTATACGGAFLSALGNVNMCSQPGVSAITTAKLSAAKQAKMAGQIVKDSGIVGAVICPLAYNTAMGFLTGQLPSACGCTQSFDAGNGGAALIAACEAAIPL